MNKKAYLITNIEEYGKFISLQQRRNSKKKKKKKAR